MKWLYLIALEERSLKILPGDKMTSNQMSVADWVLASAAFKSTLLTSTHCNNRRDLPLNNLPDQKDLCSNTRSRIQFVDIQDIVDQILHNLWTGSIFSARIPVTWPHHCYVFQRYGSSPRFRLAVYGYRGSYAGERLFLKDSHDEHLPCLALSRFWYMSSRGFSSVISRAT